MSLDPAQSRKILDKLLAMAKKAAPGADVTVQVGARHGGNTRFARGQVTSSADVETRSVEIEIALGLRHAGAVTNQTDDASLAALADRAARLARLAPEDPEQLPPLGAQKYVPARAAYDAATDTMSPLLRAQAAGAAMAAGKAKQLDVAGFYEHAGSSQARANSAGQFGHHRFTAASFTCTA